jgi:hypothetical protein
MYRKPFSIVIVEKLLYILAFIYEILKTGTFCPVFCEKTQLKTLKTA